MNRIFKSDLQLPVETIIQEVVPDMIAKAIKTHLPFNPDLMTVHDLKESADVLRTLIHRRNSVETQCAGDRAMMAEYFMNSFDVLTQGLEVDDG